MADSYTARVKGSSAILPRGYPWVFLVGYGITAAVLAIENWLLGPLKMVFVALFAANAIFWFYYFRNIKTKAFAADAKGIRLGLRRTEQWRDRRSHIVIPWDQVQEIRISPTAAGSTADIVLAPSAPVLRSKAPPPPVAFVLEFVPPFAFLARPAMLKPLADPPRYHVPLYRVTTADLVPALRQLAPASVPVTEVGSSYASQ